jgi:hypothetical protein
MQSLFSVHVRRTVDLDMQVLTIFNPTTLLTQCGRKVVQLLTDCFLMLSTSSSLRIAPISRITCTR